MTADIEKSLTVEVVHADKLFPAVILDIDGSVVTVRYTYENSSFIQEIDIKKNPESLLKTASSKEKF